MNAEGALRVGVYDPRPRFCGESELTQRDLRIVRMAFGVNRDAASRWIPPWYLEPVPGSEAGAALNVRSETLWQRPPEWLGAIPGPLEGWRGRLNRALAPATVVRGSGPAELWLDPPLARPFDWSRWHGFAALPHVQDWVSSVLGEDCPAFPAGVWLEPEEGELRYTLTMSRPDRGAPFVLSAYRREAALWSDFRRERLDVVLLEGDDLAHARIGDESGLVWGQESGTQQIVLLASPALRTELGPEHWAALSRALPRDELAPIQGAGRLAPARGFLAPLWKKRPPDASAGSPSALQSNPREARRIWLAASPERTRLSLATIANPVLEAFARRIGEQWQRTLNLKTTVTPVSLDGFAASLAAWEHDLYLTAADLDDGSLQDLWEESLRDLDALGEEGPTLTDKRMAAWEDALQGALPYLPILENVHLALARDPAAIRAICPACQVPIPPPARGGSSEPVVPPEG